MDTGTQIELIWDKLQAYAEDSLGGRIGAGERQDNDSEYAAEWAEICEAMDHIQTACGLERDMSGAQPTGYLIPIKESIK